MPVTQSVNFLARFGISRFVAAPVIVALLLAVPVIMICDHRTVRTIDHVTVTPDPVRPGETAILIFTATDYRACYNKTSRWLTDSKGFRYYLVDHDSTEYDEDVGKPSHQFVREFPIPKSMSSGTATFHARVTRWCNPLQRIFWPMYSTDTTVNFQVK